VTGGEDKKVNLWAIGKPNCIMSLGGHTTAIQSVRFGPTENQVCAGSLAGTLKIWDLEAPRLIRSLSGHKGSIRAIEFHPYGNFIASGSSDANVKLWDIRRKGCINTYQGHVMAVNSLRFSPDGQWVASAGQEGTVKLWDLRTGKMLREFPEHMGPVNSVEFHPHEFLLASASQDETLNFWDLENFTLVSATNKEVPYSRSLHFSSGGECLFAGGTDILRVYGWEPARTIASILIPWGKIQDMVTTDTRLIGASYHLSNVSIWIVDPSQLSEQPNSEESSPVHTSPFSHGNSLRKSFNKQKPTPEARKSLSVKTIEESERSETDPEDDTAPEIPDVNDYRAVFQPSRSYITAPQVIQTPFPPSPPRISFEPPTPSIDHSVLRQRSVSPQEKVRETQRRHSTCREETSDHETEFPVKLSSIHHSSSETSLPRVITQHRSVSKHTKATFHSNLSNKTVLRETKSDKGCSVTSSRAVSPSLINSTERHEEFVPMATDKPSGLDLDDFLPKNYQRGLSYSQSVPDMSEAEVLSSLNRGYESIMAILVTRNRNLQIVHSLWRNKDLKAAVDAAVNMSDNSVIVDFLGVIIHRPRVWNLDICVVVLPAIYDLLQSKYETHMRAGCEALRLIVRNFISLIKSNVFSGCSTVGVDICREERYNKCMKCYNNLLAIRSFLLKRQTLQGPLGQIFRDLHVSLQTIDAN